MRLVFWWFFPLLLACGSDPCEQVCYSVGTRLDACKEDWGADWATFGANSRRDFVNGCLEEWGQVRSDLEARQTDVAEDQCQETVDDLPRVSCDEMRALYL